MRPRFVTSQIRWGPQELTFSLLSPDPLGTPRPGPWTFSEHESSAIPFLWGVEGW